MTVAEALSSPSPVSEKPLVFSALITVIVSDKFWEQDRANRQVTGGARANPIDSGGVFLRSS